MQAARFGEKHTRADYNAIMNYARVTPPAVKENYVDIAGGDSSIDLTEAVGGVVFEDGEIEFKFTLDDEGAKNRMKNDLHGKRLEIVLEREPECCYEGRLSFTREDPPQGVYALYAKARVSPYKLERRATVHEETVDGEKEIILLNSRMPVMPEITVSGSLVVAYGGVAALLSDGTFKIPEITFQEGVNRLNVSGKGAIRLTYRKGALI